MKKARPEVIEAITKSFPLLLQKLSLKELIRVEAHARAWGIFPQWAGYANKEKG